MTIPSFKQFLKEQTAVDINDDANEAQTSAHNGIEAELTDAQKLTGEYRKGIINFQGIPIQIENPKHSVRRGIDNEWANTQFAHYGFITDTIGADGDELDVYVSDNPDSPNVWVINQEVDGKFDEVKIMLGFIEVGDAMRAYYLSFDEDSQVPANWVKTTDIDALKQWLASGDTLGMYP